MILLKDNNGTCMHTDGIGGIDSRVGTFCFSTAENANPKKV
jgi:hypothetical protein